MKVLLVSCGDVATQAGLLFAADGHEVTGWRRHSAKLPAQFTGQDVDLLDPAGWPAIDPGTEIAVFTPVPATRDVPGYERGYLQVARELAARLAAQAPRLQRLVYVSSTAVCGGEDGEWINESTADAPNRPTAQVLADTEQVLRDSSLPVTILRAAGIYGPGRNHLIDQVRNGTAELPQESHWTNRIHRDDLAAAIVHVAGLGQDADELYLVGDSEPTQLGEVYEFLAGELGLPAPPAAQSPAPRSAANRRVSNRKLLASGLQLAYPGYREGYRAVLSGVSARHR